MTSRARATKWIRRVEDGSKEQQAQGHGQARQHAIDKQGRLWAGEEANGEGWVRGACRRRKGEHAARGGQTRQMWHGKQPGGLSTDREAGVSQSCSSHIIGYHQSSQPDGRPRVSPCPARGPTCDAQSIIARLDLPFLHAPISPLSPYPPRKFLLPDTHMIVSFLPCVKAINSRCQWSGQSGPWAFPREYP